ncbi:glycosyltransferase family 1 protein [Clostridium sp. D43t1_170807_H7]|uniref:glycosyltransferase family 1 protein n=1 Tax=Clostridium sp. D43t1_170807_H7 TaxID=2787140 RepID=UPI00189B47FA|nr:glycosyltransferase family 1 protein [Clostridium sp. D43t1_170807_H7]
MNKKLKVLHVVGGMNVGGTETMLMNLYREVNKKVQFDFISYYNEEAYYDEEIKKLGGKIIKLDSPSKVGQIKAIKNLYNLIKNEQYEVVHTHTLFNCGSAVLAAKLGGAKIIISHAHTNLDLGTSRVKKIYFFIMRSLINRFSTDFMACSDSAGRYLFGEGITNNKKYKVLPNYVNYKSILRCNDTNSIKEELGFNKEDIIVGHIGRFVEAKNHKFLIKVLNEMIKENRSIKAVLVGDGPLREDIENQIKKLGLEENIKLLYLRNDIDVILNNCDLFIFPSTYEGLGLVMLEAQSAGLPCLVSEAIQPEADLNVGLLKQINLDMGAKVWKNEALKLIGKKNKNKQTIELAFKYKGLDLDSIVNNLLKAYKIDMN